MRNNRLLMLTFFLVLITVVGTLHIQMMGMRKLLQRHASLAQLLQNSLKLEALSILPAAHPDYGRGLQVHWKTPKTAEASESDREMLRKLALNILSQTYPTPEFILFVEQKKQEKVLIKSTHISTYFSDYFTFGDRQSYK